MIRLTLFSLTAALIMGSPAYAETPPANPGNTAPASSNDARQFVEMPEQARALMRQDMLDHLAALNEIVSHLASNRLSSAAEVAETRMGKSSMGKHRATGMGPGRFMPLEMRKLGWGMHESATEFSQIAEKGDVTAAYAALGKITATCVACHYSYRTR